MGYTGENFANKVRGIIDATVEVVKRNELHKFVVLSDGLLNGLLVGWENCERKINTSLQMAILAFVALIVKRF